MSSGLCSDEQMKFCPSRHWVLGLLHFRWSVDLRSDRENSLVIERKAAYNICKIHYNLQLNYIKLYHYNALDFK